MSEEDQLPRYEIVAGPSHLNFATKGKKTDVFMTEIMSEEDKLPRYEIVAGPSHLNFEIREDSGSTWRDVDFSIDLLIGSLSEIEFLREIDKETDSLFQDEIIMHAVRRYENIWLPLKTQNEENLKIVPPLDVGWIWHCHRLNPIAYEVDCVSICGKVIDHKLLSNEEQVLERQLSEQLWESFAPNEPYDYIRAFRAVKSEWYDSKSSYDLFSSVERQRNFFYQVSLPHYGNAAFLKPAIKRYKKFLYLQKLYPDQFLTPCYDFDLIWHAHLAHPIAYISDTRRLIGRILPHDDSANERSAGSRLQQGENVTKQLWEQHFGEADLFWRRGSMFRGHERPSTIGISRYSLFSVNHGRLQLKGSVKRPKINRDFFKLKMTYGGRKIGRSVEVKNFHSSDDRLNFTGTFDFDRAEEPNDLLVILRAYDNGFLGRKNLKSLEAKCALAQLLPPKQKNHVVILRDDENRYSASMDLEIHVSQSRYFNLVLGKFENSELLPGDNGKLFRLCYAGALNKGAANSRNPINVMMADHRLVDLVDETVYTVRVIHSASLLLSLILVYDVKWHVLSMAHLLGPDTLPSKEQLLHASSSTDNIPSLSTPMERAVLISDHNGDFSLLHGVWSGFQSRIPGRGNNRGTPGNPGKLNVTSFGLRNRGKTLKFSLGVNSLDVLFQSGAVRSSLNGNSISMTNIWKDTCNHIASVFSVSLLFVLTNPDKVRAPSSPTSGGISCHNWPFVQAVGYTHPNPSVRYLARQASTQAQSLDTTDSAGTTDISPGLISPQNPAWWGLGAVAALGAAGVLHSGAGHGMHTHGVSELGADSGFQPNIADLSDALGDSAACAGCGAGVGGVSAGVGGVSAGDSGGGAFFGDVGISGVTSPGIGAIGGSESGGEGFDFSGAFGGGDSGGGGDGGACGGCGGCGG